MKKLLTAVFEFTCASVFAWNWADKGADVVIDENVTVANADVEKVASLTSIQINSGFTLTFTNTQRVVLSATLTGDGALNVGDGGAVTFSGNSLAYTGEMHFLNSKIVVTTDYGLGSGKKSDGTTQRFVYSDGSYHSTARPNSDGLMFSSGVTCKPGIYYYGSRTLDARTWFTQTMSDSLTFDGPVYINKPGNVDSVRVGNYIFNGEVGAEDSGHGTPGLEVYGIAYLNGGFKFPGSVSYCLVYVNNGAEIHLASKMKSFGGSGFFYGNGKVICDTNDVLPQAERVGLGQRNVKSGTLDLNGHNQTIYLLQTPTDSKYFWDPTKDEQDYVSVTSAAPATLTMNGNLSTTYPFACRFAGAVSLSKTAGGTYTLVNQYSSSTGTLSVSAGTVEFKWGAGWGGDVQISGNGKVVFDDAYTSLNGLGRSRVVLSDTAKLVISNGVEISCTSLTLGTTEVVAGRTYTSADYPDWIEGDGSVRVLDVLVTRTWTGGGSGWNDSANWGGMPAPAAGQRAQIPAGFAVEVADADVSTVSALGLLDLAAGSSVSFVNGSVACPIPAILTGSGAIRSLGASSVTLSGNNTQFYGPMEFTNTPVYVTSRTGLGSPSRAIVHWASHPLLGDNRDAPLRFRGAGLINDVPLKIQGRRNSAARAFTDDLSDPYVQNGSWDYIGAGDTAEIWFGSYTFDGGIKPTAGAVKFELRPGCTMEIKDKALDVNSVNARFTIGAGARLLFNANGAKWKNFFSFCGDGTIVCGASNVLCNGVAMCLASTNSVTVLDLDGHNQWPGSVLYHQTDSLNGSDNATRDSVGYGIVTSATPATISMSYGATRINALKYTGKASLTRNGSGTYTLVNKYSDTAGTLTVGSGEVKFDWGAGWGGDIAVSGTGKVTFAAKCPENDNGTATGSATVSGTGKLVVASGVRYCCAKLRLGTTDIPRGYYTAAQLNALSSGSWIDGAGKICVGNAKPGFVVILK